MISGYGYHAGMIKLASYDRVGVACINPWEDFVLAFAIEEIVWRKSRGWSGKADRMLLETTDRWKARWVGKTLGRIFD